MVRSWASSAVFSRASGAEGDESVLGAIERPGKIALSAKAWVGGIQINEICARLEGAGGRGPYNNIPIKS